MHTRPLVVMCLALAGCGGKIAAPARPASGSGAGAAPSTGAVTAPEPKAPTRAANGDLIPTAGATLTYADARAPDCELGAAIDWTASSRAAGAVIAVLQASDETRAKGIPDWFDMPGDYTLPPARVVTDVSNDVAPMVMVMTNNGLGWLIMIQGDAQSSFCVKQVGDGFEIARQ